MAEAEAEAEAEADEAIDTFDALVRQRDELLTELTHRVGWEERCLRAEAEVAVLQAVLQDREEGVLRGTIEQLRVRALAAETRLDEIEAAWARASKRAGEISAENARLTRRYEDLSRESLGQYTLLSAEVERLQAELILAKTVDPPLRLRFKTQVAEIVRLRTALRDLLEQMDRHMGGARIGPLSDARRAAEEIVGHD